MLYVIMSSVSVQIEALRTPPQIRDLHLWSDFLQPSLKCVWCRSALWEMRQAEESPDVEEPVIPTHLLLHSPAWKKSLTYPLKEKSLIGEWVWSEVDSTQRMQKMHYLDLGGGKTDPVSSQGPISAVYDVGSKHLFTTGCVFSPSALSPGQGTLVGFHDGSTTEWVWLHRTNLGAFWHYTAQPWGQRKALSSEAQRSDFSLAPWEQRRIMNSRAPGITFGFTRVNSILERNKRAVGETFVGRERRARGMPCRVSLEHFNGILMAMILMRLVGGCFFQTYGETCTIKAETRADILHEGVVELQLQLMAAIQHKQNQSCTSSKHLSNMSL